MRIALMFITNLYRLPYLLFKLFRLSNPKRSYTKEEKYAFLHHTVVGCNRGGRVKVDLKGLENLPAQSGLTVTSDSGSEAVAAPGYIMYSNHQGLYDVLSLVQEIEAPFSVISKIEVKDVFLLKNVLYLLGNEFMDRDDIRQSLKVIQTVAGRVKAGDIFCIFPEGTRSKNGNHVGEFKPGAFKAATMAKAPIVPVAMVDSFLPFDKKSIKKVTVHVRILPPIMPDEYAGMKTTEISEIVKGRIEETIAETLKELGRDINLE